MLAFADHVVLTQLGNLIQETILEGAQDAEASQGAIGDVLAGDSQGQISCRCGEGLRALLSLPVLAQAWSTRRWNFHICRSTTPPLQISLFKMSLFTKVEEVIARANQQAASKQMNLGAKEDALCKRNWTQRSVLDAEVADASCWSEPCACLSAAQRAGRKFQIACASRQVPTRASAKPVLPQACRSPRK